MPALNARLLRIILIASLMLLAASGTAGFYYIQNILRSDAMQISALNTEAAASEQKIIAFKNIQSYLESHTEDQQNAAKIVSDSKQYHYQDEIIDAVSAIAAKSNVTITSYTFNEAAAATGNTTAAPPASTPAAGSGGAATDGGSSAPAAATLNSKSVTVAIKNPVNYRNLLSFVRRIEQNSTKMQIASISLSRATSESGESVSNSVTTNAFTIEVYVN